jgi:hypothetical protein
VPLQGAPRLPGGAALALAPGAVGAGGLVAAGLDEHDLVHQAVQAAVALPVQPVPHPAGGGRLERGDARQRGELGLPEARPRAAQLGDESGGDDGALAGSAPTTAPCIPALPALRAPAGARERP